jgi:rhodanese-related sulfurtransferase
MGDRAGARQWPEPRAVRYHGAMLVRPRLARIVSRHAFSGLLVLVAWLAACSDDSSAPAAMGGAGANAGASGADAAAGSGGAGGTGAASGAAGVGGTGGTAGASGGGAAAGGGGTAGGGASGGAAADAGPDQVADGAPSDSPVDAGEDGSQDGSGADADAAPVLGSVTPQQLHAELGAKDFLLVNVHIPYAGEIPGTDTHIPYTDPDKIAAYIGSDLGKKTVVYCLTDHMATLAGNALVGKGYSSVRYLLGGMTAWTAAGYPLQ